MHQPTSSAFPDYETYFCVDKIEGNNEYEIFKNYKNALNETQIREFFRITFAPENLKTKNDSLANEYRKRGDTLCNEKYFKSAIAYYSKAVRYATFMEHTYAVAISHRSLALFLLGEYEACLQDIYMCLKTLYPMELRPILYIRKALCYQRLGAAEDLHSAIKDALIILHEIPSLSKEDIVYRKKQINAIITGKLAEPLNVEQFHRIPSITENNKFLNASASVELSHHTLCGRYVVAKERISKGETIFVEKAYAFAPFYDKKRRSIKSNCYYCLEPILATVPCDNCVKWIYCSPECKFFAWREFHQWECYGVKASFFRRLPLNMLPLRIILTAVHKGFTISTTDYNKDTKKYGNVEDNYEYVHKLFFQNFDAIKKATFLKHLGTTTMLIYYLCLKTNFLEKVKALPSSSNQSENDIIQTIGGLLLRHSLQVFYNTLYVKKLQEDSLNRISIAIALLPSTMMMNHSCTPNTTYYFVGDVIVVKAVDDIQKDEEIFRAYLDVTYSDMTLNKRKSVIFDLWHFVCTCEACTDIKLNVEVFNSYQCIYCQGPILPYQTMRLFNCLDCGCTFELPQEVKVKEQVARRLVDRYKTQFQIKDVTKALEIYTSILNPLHRVIGELYMIIADYYRFHTIDMVRYIDESSYILDYAQSIFGSYPFDNALCVFRVLSTVVENITNKRWSVPIENVQSWIMGIQDLLSYSATLFNMYHPPYLPYILRMKQLLLFTPNLAEVPWMCIRCKRNCIKCRCTAIVFPSNV